MAAVDDGPISPAMKCFIRTRGLLSAVASAFLFAAKMIFMTNIEGITVLENLTFHMGSLLLVTTIWILSTKTQPHMKLTWLWLGFLAMYLSGIAFLTAAVNMNYGDASAIYFSSPILVGIFACLFLKEPCGPVLVMCTLLMTAGMIMVIRPQTIFADAESQCLNCSHITTNFHIHKSECANSCGAKEVEDVTSANNQTDTSAINQSECFKYCEVNRNNHSSLSNETVSNQPDCWNWCTQKRNQSQEESNARLNKTRAGQKFRKVPVKWSISNLMRPHALSRSWACILAVSGTIFSSISIVVVRAYSSLDTAAISFNFSIIGLVLSIVLNSAIGGWTLPQDLGTWGLVFGMSISAALAYTLNFIALNYESAAVVSICKTSEIAFAFLMEYLIDGKVPKTMSIVGAIIIIAVAVFRGISNLFNMEIYCPSQGRCWKDEDMERATLLKERCPLAGENHSDTKDGGSK
ncbi:uncharacterized protein LOC135492362 [Lineus longissimus]|uniref:uncharacterized protein LOC135492362 n=1 Tax=Lineus longissimus TaxID=88925 RepID=UPI00315CD033